MVTPDSQRKDSEIELACACNFPRVHMVFAFAWGDRWARMQEDCFVLGS